MTSDEARPREAVQRPSPIRLDKPSSTPDMADPPSPRPDDAADRQQHATPGRRPLFGS